tara:strand:+ start:1385 stop:1882 length:498 start_codon:yes stop_codon:yes gene_type:complete
MSDPKDKWKQPEQPPSPLFTGQRERDLVKQVNDELIERVVGQELLYFPLDIEHTNYHDLYGEAMNKTYLPPIAVKALIDWEGVETAYLESMGIDRKTTFTAHFHKRRLTEDQDLFVREGDMVRYGTQFYQIVTVSEPKHLFGQVEHAMEISAKCVKVREGIFDGE